MSVSFIIWLTASTLSLNACLFDPFKARRDELVKDPAALEDILQEGAKKARAAAAPTMEKVRRAVGL